MRLDWKKLKAAIADDKKKLREYKSNHAKALATLHCAIAAHARGHIHLTKWGEELPHKMLRVPTYAGRPMTLEEQEKFISKDVEYFLLKEAPVVNGPSSESVSA